MFCGQISSCRGKEGGDLEKNICLVAGAGECGNRPTLLLLFPPPPWSGFCRTLRAEITKREAILASSSSLHKHRSGREKKKDLPRHVRKESTLMILEEGKEERKTRAAFV